MGLGDPLEIKSLLLSLFKQFFPPACPLCGQTLPSGYDDPFCITCLNGFKSIPPAHCFHCSLPFTGASRSSHLCGRCTKQLPAYAKVFAVGLYEGSLRQAIHQFKFNSKVGLDQSLGILLEQAVAADLNIDLVIPVPLHRKRLQQRSYNQALLLAREFSKIRRLPLSQDLLLKLEETEPQQNLSAKKRFENLQGVFSLHNSIYGKTILLIDDVMTTGATVDACSQILLRGGAVLVYVAVIGRAA